MNHQLSLSLLKKRGDTLRDWLSACGAEVLEPTNEWEVLRYRSHGQTSVVYKNARGKLTFTGDAADALTAFMKGQPWTGTTKTKRIRVSPAIRAIRKRDGDRCFFCGLIVQDDDASVDHLVAVAHGGPNHISNYLLMHILCNQQCGHLSAPEKIRAHIEWQLADQSNTGRSPGPTESNQQHQRRSVTMEGETQTQEQTTGGEQQQEQQPGTAGTDAAAVGETKTEETKTE